MKFQGERKYVRDDVGQGKTYVETVGFVDG